MRNNDCAQLKNQKMNSIKTVTTKTFSEQDTLDDVGIWLGENIDFKIGNGQPPFNLKSNIRITISEV